MNLEEALRKFESMKNGEFSSEDKATITEIICGIGVSEFEVYAPSDKPVYFFDCNDLVHVHATMVVSRQPFKGSVDRGPKPYPKYPHHLALSQWKSSFGSLREKDGVPEILCNSYFVWVPIGTECRCGDFHREALTEFESSEFDHE